MPKVFKATVRQHLFIGISNCCRATLMSETLDRYVTHKEFMGIIQQFAELHGWMVYFTWQSKHSPAGYPDLTMVRERDKRLITAEVKTVKDKPTIQQEEWLRILRAVNCSEVYLWYPKDWDDIEKVLK